MEEKILIIDFGSQYTQLIARRIRELNVYCEIHPFNSLPKLDNKISGVVLSKIFFHKVIFCKYNLQKNYIYFNNIDILKLYS